MDKLVRIGVLAVAPSAQLNAQYEKVGRLNGVDITLLFRRYRADSGAWRCEYPEGMNYEMLPGAEKQHCRGLRGYWSRSVRPLLERSDFDGMIIHGIYDSREVHQAIGWCRRNKRPYMIRCDGNIQRERKRAWPAGRGFLVEPVIRNAASLLSIGSRNSEYYRHFGAQEQQIVIAPWEIDYFALEKHIESAVGRGKRATGEPSKTLVICTICRLVRRKRCQDVIRSAAALEAVGVGTRVVIVGDGPERTHLERLAESLGVDACFRGSIGRRDVVECLTGSDVFVLASADEPWGLAVNEACLAGLPVVASSAVGAAADLVVPEESGFLFNPADVRELSRCLLALARDTGLRRRMGGESWRLIQRWRKRNPAINGYREALARCFPIEQNCKGT